MQESARTYASICSQGTPVLTCQVRHRSRVRPTMTPASRKTRDGGTACRTYYKIPTWQNCIESVPPGLAILHTPLVLRHLSPEQDWLNTHHKKKEHTVKGDLFIQIRRGDHVAPAAGAASRIVESGHSTVITSPTRLQNETTEYI